MLRIASLLPALLLVFACVPTADAAVQYYLDANAVDSTGGSFTVSASADAGESLDDLGLELEFSGFGGPQAGNDLKIVSSVGHPGLMDDDTGDPIPALLGDGGSLLRWFVPNPGPSFAIPAAKTALATFSFTGESDLFPATSSFTVSLASILTTPAMISLPPAPLTITNAAAVPEPGTVVALACLAAGAGFRRRFSSLRKTAPAV